LSFFRKFVVGRVAIDASNIIRGGGITHLRNIIDACRLEEPGVESVHIWGDQRLEVQVGSKTNVVWHSPRWVSARYLRFVAAQLIFPFSAWWERCEIILAPGGTVPLLGLRPAVAICQNLLPFDANATNLFGRWSSMAFKMRVLRIVHSVSFYRAAGVIFLTEFARDKVVDGTPLPIRHSAVIPHGIESRFFRKLRTRSEAEFSSPVKLIYVSIFLPYKHQLEVLKALKSFGSERVGPPLEMTFVGDFNTPYGMEVLDYYNSNDFYNCSVRFAGEVDNPSVDSLYDGKDAIIFASSCENLPMILMEGMASGLPVLCSCNEPMASVVGDSAILFEPKDPESIEMALRNFVANQDFFSENEESEVLASKYSWSKCANLTFRRALQWSRANGK